MLRWRNKQPFSGIFALSKILFLLSWFYLFFSNMMDVWGQNYVFIFFFILPSENEVMVLLFNKKREISFSFLEQEAFQHGANFVLVPPRIAMLIYSNFHFVGGFVCLMRNFFFGLNWAIVASMSVFPLLFFYRNIFVLIHLDFFFFEFIHYIITD